MTGQPEDAAGDPHGATPEDHVVTPEVVEPRAGAQTSSVSEPSKLIRIASMTRAMLEEAREADLDEPGRQRLLHIHERSLDEMREVISEDLREELASIFLPLRQDETPTEAELRITQAQLVGWLEGLFAGIQASLVSQHLAAQQQLHQLETRHQGDGTDDQFPGAYL